MNGLLVYTASGDAEGTLGGLVSQAESGRWNGWWHQRSDARCGAPTIRFAWKAPVLV
jgi:hypothetical protein